MIFRTGRGREANEKRPERGREFDTIKRETLKKHNKLHDLKRE